MTFPAWTSLSGNAPRSSAPDLTPGATGVPSVLARMPVAVLVVRTDGTLRFANAAAVELFGTALDRGLDTLAWIDVVAPDDRDALLHLLSDPAPTAPVDLRLVRRTGEVRFASVHAYPDTGTIGLVFLDVTEQSATVAALHHSELLYSTFLEQSPVGMIHVDVAGTVTFENHRFRQIVGEGPDDAWIGLPAATQPGTDAALRDALRRVLDGETVEGCEVRYAPPGRPLRHLRVYASPIRQPDDGLVGAVLMVQDVTAEVAQDEEAALGERFGRAETELRSIVLTTSSESALLGEMVRLVATALDVPRAALFLPDDLDATRFVARARWGAQMPSLARQPLYLTDAVIDEAVRQRGVASLDPAPEAAQRVAVPFFEAGVLAGFVLVEHPQGVPSLLDGPRERLLLGFVRLFETLRSWFISTDRFRLTVAAIDDCLFTYALEMRAPRRYLLLTPQIARIAGVPASTFLEHLGAWETLLDGAESIEAVREHMVRLGRGLDSEAVYRLRRPDGAVRVVRERATPQRTDSGLPRAAGILSDITEQAAAEQALRDAKAAAERSDQDKTAFIQTLSHELRTPLGALSGFADLIDVELNDTADRETLAEFTATIRAKARQTLGLVNDLFSLMQLDDDSLELASTPVAIDPLVRHVAERAHAAAEDTARQVRLDLDLDPAVALGDAHRIEQVLDHLLSNAFKFTSEGHVRAATHQDGKTVTIVVEDSGIGISPEYQARLFTPFVQEDQRLNRSYAGTGVGLALVKRLVDRMGGTVKVESEKGLGTTFTVHLPAAAEAESPALTEPETQPSPAPQQSPTPRQSEAPAPRFG